LRPLALLAVSVCAVSGLLYLAARETPVFALRDVEVRGAPAEVRQAVVREIGDLRGQSLVALDGAAVVRRLENLPSVRSVSYDRAFPHTLRLVVQAERPVAIIHAGEGAWVISVRGRVIGAALPKAARGLPRIKAGGNRALAAGEFVGDATTRTVLAALALAPKQFPLPLHAARLEDGELTFVLAGAGGSRPELLLGEPADVAVKLRVAALVLRHLSSEERASLAYLDVSLPDRPVASDNPKVSG
jgi:cell division protein FtsQ